jgi:hypothetical protein
MELIGTLPSTPKIGNLSLRDIINVHRTPKVAGAKAAAVVAEAIRAATTFMTDY